MDGSNRSARNCQGRTMDTFITEYYAVLRSTTMAFVTMDEARAICCRGSSVSYPRATSFAGCSLISSRLIGIPFRFPLPPARSPLQGCSWLPLSAAIRLRPGPAGHLCLCSLRLPWTAINCRQPWPISYLVFETQVLRPAPLDRARLTISLANVLAPLLFGVTVLVAAVLPTATP